MSIEWKRTLKPQGRSYKDVIEMLLSIIHIRPVLLLCKQCRGEHVCCDRSLTIHCACGTVTRYQSYAIFHIWSSLSWALARVSQRYAAGEGNLLRLTALTTARIVDEPLVNPQLPLDTRVGLWRLRGAR
jgi:hypothetical protein